MIFYADTSILLKQHVNEAGARWFRNVVASSTDSILTAEISVVELYSAFNRLMREGRLTLDVYQDLTIALKRLFESRYLSIAFTNDVRDMACRLLERHPLRAYDSLHLALAIFSNQELVSRGKAGLTFLSADQRLFDAATAEGLTTFNPAIAR